MTLSQARVRELLDYNPDTGIFKWRVSSARYRPGDIAGTKHIQGYLKCGIDGQRYLMHRLVWLYVHGHFPEADIDHINMNKTDNRMCNLRAATRSQNFANKPRASGNRSGFKGIWLDSRRCKWQARIGVNRTRVHLGTFDTPEAAHAAYAEAAVKYYGDFARAE